MKHQKKSLRPNRPLNLRVTDFTDKSITFAWDDNTAKEYLLYIGGEDKPRRFKTNVAVVSGLTPQTFYSAKVSGKNGFLEGESSNIVAQKTKVPIATLDTYYYGATYLTGEGMAGENITNCRIFKHGSTTAFATGTMTGTKLKIYLTANPNIVPGELYDVCVLDKSGTTIIEGMKTTFKVEIPQISLNPVTTAKKVVAGVTAKNIQVRISQNGVAKTIIWSDVETGAYSWNVSPLVVNDVIKVETKVGSEYSSSVEFKVVT